MTNDGWGKEWITEAAPITKEAWDNISLRKLESYELIKDALITKEALAGVPVFIGADLASKPDTTIYGAYTKDGFVPLTKEEFENKFKNTSPTHNPYTNPDSHIYYQCSCGAILDPGTKSFAALNNCASEKGWKVRWGADSYQPYCVECGKDVE